MTEPPDRALQALDALLAAVDETADDVVRLRERGDFIRARRAEGVPFRELIPLEQPPLIVQLLAQIHDRLNRTGAEWRRREALALRAEGLSMEAIAALFGVTRQRISALLKSPGGRDDGG